MQWTGWALLALGVWLIVAPFALGYSAIDAAVINDGTFGVLIVGLACIAYGGTPARGRGVRLPRVGGRSLGRVCAFLAEIRAMAGPGPGAECGPYVADYPVPAIVNDVVVGFSVVILGLCTRSPSAHGGTPELSVRKQTRGQREGGEAKLEGRGRNGHAPRRH